MSDTNVCRRCAAAMRKRDEQWSATRRALAKSIGEAHRNLGIAVVAENYSAAATYRAYLSGLQVALAILGGAEVGK